MSTILNDELSSNWDDWSDFVPPKQVITSAGTSNDSRIASTSKAGNNSASVNRPFLEGAFSGVVVIFSEGGPASIGTFSDGGSNHL